MTLEVQQQRRCPVEVIFVFVQEMLGRMKMQQSAKSVMVHVLHLCTAMYV